jgi:hypothetical protein
MSLTARGRVGWLATGDVAVALGNVVLSLVLALGLGMGILGFAISNAVALLAKDLMMLSIASRIDASIPPVAELLRAIPRAALGSAPGLALLYSMRPFIGGNLATVMAAGTACGAVALAGSAWVTLGPGEIRRLSATFLRRRAGR